LFGKDRAIVQQTVKTHDKTQQTAVMSQDDDFDFILYTHNKTQQFCAMTELPQRPLAYC